MTKTITRLFDNYSDASAAVSELERLGIPHDDISLVANNADEVHKTERTHDAVGDDAGKGATAGAVLGGAGGLLAGLGMLAIPGLGPVVAAGWLVSTIVGAGAGAVAGGAAGGLVGALTRAGVDEKDAHVYSEGVRRGGSLVSARVPDQLAPQAESVLRQHGSVDAATRGSAYRAEGWTTFDESAPAYTREQVQRERSLYGSADAPL
jgi:hypothetical protein